MPTTSGMPARSTAARLSGRASGSVKSMAIRALASAWARSAVTGTATGPVWATSPASRPSAALVGEARAPVRVKSGDSRIARTRQRPDPSADPEHRDVRHVSCRSWRRTAARPRTRSAGADCGSGRPPRGQLSNLRSSSFCCALRSTGVSTTTRQNRSPVAPPRTGLMPLSRRRNTRPDWVPAGILIGRLALERRHVDAAAERGGRETDRHLAGEVGTVALEDRVLAHDDLDVEIARRTAVAARFALAREADAVAVVDARRHLDRQPLGSRACGRARRTSGRAP